MSQTPQESHFFPVRYDKSHSDEGLLLRDYLASQVKDDFDELPVKIQELLVGSEKPEPPTNLTQNPTLDYAMFLAKGRAVWRLCQADEIIKQKEL